MFQNGQDTDYTQVYFACQVTDYSQVYLAGQGVNMVVSFTDKKCVQKQISKVTRHTHSTTHHHRASHDTTRPRVTIQLEICFMKSFKLNKNLN